jgi:hypothetical protein
MPGAALDLFGGSSGQNSALENVIDRLNRNIPITPMRIITPTRISGSLAIFTAMRRASSCFTPGPAFPYVSTAGAKAMSRPGVFGAAHATNNETGIKGQHSAFDRDASGSQLRKPPVLRLAVPPQRLQVRLQPAPY